MNANLTHPTGCQTNPPKAYEEASPDYVNYSNRMKPGKD